MNFIILSWFWLFQTSFNRSNFLILMQFGHCPILMCICSCEVPQNYIKIQFNPLENAYHFKRVQSYHTHITYSTGMGLSWRWLRVHLTSLNSDYIFNSIYIGIHFKTFNKNTLNNSIKLANELIPVGSCLTTNTLNTVPKEVLLQILFPFRNFHKGILSFAPTQLQSNDCLYIFRSNFTSVLFVCQWCQWIIGFSYNDHDNKIRPRKFIFLLTNEQS